MVSRADAGQTIPTVTTKRQLPVDALRGFIIVVMALDHANYFVAQQHSSGEYWGGPFPFYVEALPFITRLITHLAAPGFFMLMGVGMALFSHSRGSKGWGHWVMLRHFWLRGAILITLQLLIVNRAWELSPSGWQPEHYIGVLFALGGTMILASLFLWVDSRLLIVLTFFLFLGTELIHPDPTQWNEVVSTPLKMIFTSPGGDLHLWSNYPILPWLPLVIFGLVFGSWLIEDPARAYRRGLFLSGAFLLSFLILRFLDGFGNIRPRMGDSWIDFFNLVKYPPSMTFTLLTTGINLFFLWLFYRLAGARSKLLQPLAVFGRTPLFFYILHLFLYAFFGQFFAPEGSSITAMIPVWILGLVILWPLCFLYAKVKYKRKADLVLRYL